jgi:exodeoxyribonuclease V gamma subunit
MLRLVYSNRTENLLQALIADVGALRAERGALEPVCLVLPNRNIETYVRFGFARATGIAANLHTHQLRRFVGSLLPGQGQAPQPVDAEQLTGHLLELLLDPQTLADPQLLPVRGYLLGGGASDEAADVRRLQLAERLARLFEEYSFTRQSMLAAWPERTVLGQTPLAETERWQRALWLKLFDRQGLLAQRTREDGVARVHLGALLPLLQSAGLPLPPQIHLFGVSHVAPVFQRILGALAARTALHVYTLNPCREFWEDVTPGRRRPARLGEAALESEDPFGLVRDGENPALRLWGKPGRENVRLLNELADCDFAEAFDDAAPDTLLGRLQQQILERAPLPAVAPGHPVDGSIRVLACPGVRREAEAVAEEIWAVVQDDAARAVAEGRAPLRFNEIAVIVAGRDREDYFTQLSAAFRACHGIPHNLVDLELAKVSRIAEAAARLLQLPLGQLTRPELLGVLTHPCARARVPGLDTESWVTWCERLEIVHGGDRRDHEGTYIAHDVFNWDQGLRRLALGAFMSGERSGEPRPLQLGEDAYLPEEHDRGSQVAAARLAMGARSLIADARFAREAQLSPRDWATFLCALCEAHLEPGDAAEERELSQVISALRGLGELDLGEHRVGYALAQGLATRALAGLPGGRGQHLADGVVVSTSQPMRAIPFRAVFIVGLGEGQFPATDRRNPLDLRAARPVPGDISPREQDRYLFLEALLCTRERLTLSYVARSPVSGEALEPSPVVHELLQMLEQGQLGPGQRQALIRRYPLQRHLLPTENAVEVARPGAITFAEVERERTAVRLREHFIAAQGRPPPPLSALAGQLAPETWERLATELGLPQSVGAIDARPERLVVRLSALRQFLQCPLQGHAAHQLRLAERDDEDEALSERDEERFETPRLTSTVHLRQLFIEAMALPSGRAARDLTVPHALAFERLSRAGRVPAGLFGKTERDRQARVLRAWQQGLLAGPLRAAALTRVGFGGSREGESIDLAHPPLLLQVKLRGPAGVQQMAQVELVGALGLLGSEPWASLVLKEGAAPKSFAESAGKVGLPGLVDHLVLAAAGLHTGPHTVHALYGDGGGGTLTLEAMEPDQARDQLEKIVSDLLSDSHAYLLPCEAVFAVCGPKKVSTRETKEKSFAEVIDGLLSRSDVHFSSRSGPVRDLDLYDPPDEDRARALAERRFGAYLRATIDGEAA